LKVDGKLNWRNLFGFLCFCLLYFIVQNGVLLTIYFAVAADVNVGVITTIWSICPFFLALADYLMFKVRLSSHHYIGITLIVISTILISLIKVIDPEFKVETALPSQATVPTIIPVLFGLLTPVFFTTFGMTLKHLT